MDDFNKSVMYKFSKSLKMYDITYLRSRLGTVDGITSLDIDADTVHLEFDTLKLSQGYIQMIIMNLGYPVKFHEGTHPGIFKRFIQHLAKSNQESFGDKKPDCCEMKDQTLQKAEFIK